MVFTSHLFLFYFLPLVLAVYHLLPASARWRNPWLLFASYVFYGWAGPAYLPLMLAVTVIAWAAGLALGRAGPDSARGGRILALALTAFLALLGFFKYFDFALSNLGALSRALGGPAPGLWHVVLPVGISFYIFHAISYCFDVRRGRVPPARSFPDLACYLALFPQLVAGPIVRYADVAGQLAERPAVPPRFAAGVSLFILGFAKKTLLADPLAPVADAAFGAHGLTAGEAWLGAVAYAFQIYFDFSGYSDMAVGLGRMFGFEFVQNFRAPYRAESITDFWRRWHISLGTFLRDYLYLPLGGNRGSTLQTCRNLAVVMLLGGLWHGANWTFVAWGAWHGFLLGAERWASGRFPWELPRPFRIATTFVLVLFSWVLFRSHTLSDAASYTKTMLGLAENSAANPLLAAQLHSPAALACLGLSAAFVLAPRPAQDWSDTLTWPRALLLPAVFAAAILALFAQDSQPFLYFQF